MAKALNRFPREVEALTPDEFWELFAEFKIEGDEWKRDHPDT